MSSPQRTRSFQSPANGGPPGEFLVHVGHRGASPPPDGLHYPQLQVSKRTVHARAPRVVRRATYAGYRSSVSATFKAIPPRTEQSSVAPFGRREGPFTGLPAQRLDPAFYAGARRHLPQSSTSPQPPGPRLGAQGAWGPMRGGFQAARAPSSKPAKAGLGRKKRVSSPAPSQRLGSTPPGGKGR